jgi:hypothetical protein
MSSGTSLRAGRVGREKEVHTRKRARGDSHQTESGMTAAQDAVPLIAVHLLLYLHACPRPFRLWPAPTWVHVSKDTHQSLRRSARMSPHLVLSISSFITNMLRIEKRGTTSC